MTDIVLHLNGKQFRVLVLMARDDLRTPRDQAQYIFNDALAREDLRRYPDHSVHLIDSLNGSQDAASLKADA